MLAHCSAADMVIRAIAVLIVAVTLRPTEMIRVVLHPMICFVIGMCWSQPIKRLHCARAMSVVGIEPHRDESGSLKRLKPSF